MTQDLKSLVSTAAKVLLQILLIILFLPHYQVFEKITHRPLKAFVASDVTLRKGHLRDFYTTKKHEADYVAVAGAVMVASVPGCLTWPIAADAHWSGPSLWYACVLLAVTSVFLASQQALVLRDLEMDKKLENDDYVESIRQHFLSWIVDERKPEPVVTKLFVWQAPIMFLGFSVFCFLGGLCSVIFSPLARTLEWAPQAKTAVMFLFAAILSAVTFTLTSAYVHRLSGKADLLEHAASPASPKPTPVPWGR